MLNLVIRRKAQRFEAKARYDVEKKEFVVLKGSRVSDSVSDTGKFRSANAVKKLREAYVKDHIVVQDVCFHSSSTAANFVTGISTNGKLAWKDKDGNSLKKLLG